MYCSGGDAGCWSESPAPTLLSDHSLRTETQTKTYLFTALTIKDYQIKSLQLKINYFKRAKTHTSCCWRLYSVEVLVVLVVRQDIPKLGNINS